MLDLACVTSESEVIFIISGDIGIEDIHCEEMTTYTK